MSHSERTEMRKVFFECFRKHQQQLPLEPVEAQLIEIILLHPEYHAFLTNADHIDDKDFLEQNPFLHISLHLALREQIATDRPLGIKNIYQILCKKLGDIHTAEHRMMDCLAQIIWDAQQSGIMTEEQGYLLKLQQLV